MMLNEIIVLIFGIIIAVTILLMLRKIFFGSRTNLKINKKVNSRELFEPLENDETTALTLILSPVSGTNTISNFNQMVTFAELLASKLDLNLFDSERNPLTQQMIDHYSHQAEDFDLRNFA